MCANIYKSISDDILNLYLTTRNKDIEEVYIKCAAVTNASFKEFFELFMAVPDNSKKINTKTAEAFQSLFSVATDVGPAPQLFALSQYFIKNPSKMESLPTIRLLRSIFNSGRGGTVLGQFASIFSSAQNVIPKDVSGNEIPASIGEGELLKDLGLLEKEYQSFLNTGTVEPKKQIKPPVETDDENIDSMFDDDTIRSTKKKKETRQEKLLNTIRVTITKAQQELISAAEAVNRKDLIPHITPEVLSDPRKALSLFPNVPNSRAIMEDVPKIVKTIVKRLANGSPDEMQDLIRSRALLFSQAINDQTFYNHMMDATVDLSGITGGQKEKRKPLSVQPYGLLNPSFVFYVSLAVYHLMSKSK